MSMAIFVLIIAVCAIIGGINSSKAGNPDSTTSANNASGNPYDPIITYQKETAEFGYDIQADGTVAIKKYLVNGESVTIPEEIDGKKVTRICQNAFYYSPKLKKLSIPESITHIESAVFTGPDNFEELRYEGSRISFEKIDISSTGNLYTGHDHDYFFGIVFGKREGE